ncbi:MULTISPECIES: DUF6707 family protein [Citricoccus]|uniref:DUF6707 family protein n=1 Tax=Citricoccus TaxID=169133 RepID=UPI000255EFC4|nr:DUF6707 family protein [Citricoccus sp. CH26A]
MSAPNTAGPGAGSAASPASAAPSPARPVSSPPSRHDIGGDYLRSVKAQQVQPGDRFLTRRGEPSAPVTQTRITRDDFGTPALVIATLADERQVRIAFGSTIRVRTHRPAPALDTAADLAPVQEGSPESVVVEIAQRHPDDQRLLALAAKLSRGINMRSGAQLEDIDTMARYLFVDLDDSDGALQATTLLTSLPFDGAMGRWKSIESALALAANIHHHRGERAEAEATGARLREPDEAEPDPIRAQRQAEFRQRQLNEPNLYDREILRAESAGDLAAERGWRESRLSTLFYLRARGGSKTYTGEELDRLVRLEVQALRELADRQAAAGPEA